MRSNSEIRSEAKAALKGNWGTGALIEFVYGCINSLSSYFGIVGSLLLGFPATLGKVNTFVRFNRGERLQLDTLNSAFKKPFYTKGMVVYLLTTIYVTLWSLLFFIPGIVKSYSYFLAPYIILDDPTLTAGEAIDKSMQMMKGHKMQLFLMTLGHYALLWLSMFLLFIPAYWINAYYDTAYAKFYEEVKANY